MDQVLGEIVLAAEVIEKSSFGDARLADDLFDRGSRVTASKDDRLGFAVSFKPQI